MINFNKHILADFFCVRKAPQDFGAGIENDPLVFANEDLKTLGTVRNFVPTPAYKFFITNTLDVLFFGG